MKKLALVIVALVVLVIGAALAAPFLVDLNDYRGEIAARLKAATGRDIAIDGPIELALLPAPTIKVNRVRVANVAGASTPDFLRLGALEARIALMPLFRLALRVESLALVAPTLELETLADGRVNWRFERGRLEGAAGGAPSSAAPGAETGGGPGAAVRLDRVTVRDGVVIWRDARTGRIERIAGIDLVADARSLAGPFRAEGRFVARGAPFAFKLAVGALSGAPFPVSVELGLADAGATVSFAGSLSAPRADAELRGKLDAKGGSLARMLAAFGGAGAPAALDRPFSFTGTVNGSARALAVDKIAFEIDGLQGTGAVNAVLEGAPRYDIALAFSRLDLDRLLAGRAASDGGAADRQGREAATPANAGADAASAAGGFALPAGVTASLDARANAVIYNGAVIRQAQLSAGLADGILTIQEASALLPGGSDVTVFGSFDAANGQPHFAGQVEASSDNLRAVLDWLKLPPPPVPADRLRKLSLSSKLDVTPALARISALDLRIDLSRITGGVNVALGPRFAFNAIVSLDRLNLDGYLPAGLPAAAEGAASGAEAAAPTGQETAAAGGAPAANPFAALLAFDGELKARVGQLVYRGVPIKGLAVDAGLIGGKLTLRGLAFEDFAGARGALNGKLDAKARAFDVTYGIDAADADRLARAFGIEAAKALGALKAHGRVRGSADTATLDARFLLDGLRASVSGSVSDVDRAPKVDLAVDLAGDDLPRSAKRFGLPIAMSASAARAFRIKGKIEGGAERLALRLALAAAGGKARLDGIAIQLDRAPSYDFALSLDHDDFAALAAAFSPAAAPPPSSLGALHLGARVTGDLVKARISDFDLSVGTDRVQGEGTATWAGPRPRIDAALTAGEIALDPFLAPAAARPPAGGGESGGAAGAPAEEAKGPSKRWSREPLDLDVLRTFDGRVTLDAKALSLGAYRFDEATLALAIEDGEVTIEKLAGKLFGASAAVTGRLAATEMPTAEIAVDLAGADVEALLKAAADVDAVSGALDFNARFETSGRSLFEMVSALAGEGRVAVRDGALRGFDLARLNADLGAINDEKDALRLIGNALSGGETRIVSLDGRFTARDGVLKSDDIAVRLDGGSGKAQATVDLPRWRLALDSEFRLADHPKAPAVGIALSGPIDNPRREIRDEALRRYLATRLASTVLRKVAPKLEGKGGAAIAPLIDALTGKAPAATAAPAPAATPEPMPPLPPLPAEPAAPAAPQPAEPMPPLPPLPTEPAAPAPQKAAPQPATPQPEPAPSPEKAFESLLKGLLQGVGN